MGGAYRLSSSQRGLVANRHSRSTRASRGRPRRLRGASPLAGTLRSREGLLAAPRRAAASMAARAMRSFSSGPPRPRVVTRRGSLTQNTLPCPGVCARPPAVVEPHDLAHEVEADTRAAHAR